jgi:hypothetical protein
LWIREYGNPEERPTTWFSQFLPPKTDIIIARNLSRKLKEVRQGGNRNANTALRKSIYGRPSRGLLK